MYRSSKISCSFHVNSLFQRLTHNCCLFTEQKSTTIDEYNNMYSKKTAFPFPYILACACQISSHILISPSPIGNEALHSSNHISVKSTEVTHCCPIGNTFSSSIWALWHTFLAGVALCFCCVRKIQLCSVPLVRYWLKSLRVDNVGRIVRGDRVCLIHLYRWKYLSTISFAARIEVCEENVSL